MAKKESGAAQAQEILRDLKNKNYKPLYFLCGEEAYYIDKITAYIEENVLDENEKSFNQTVLYGRDVDLSAVIAEARRYPMMSDRTVVIVKEAQNIKDIERLGAYAENPTPSTVLVIAYKYKKLDGRKKESKTITANSVYLESEKFYDNQLPDFISQTVKEFQLTIHPTAAVLLAEYLGNDLGKIVNEIEKLSINLKPGAQITPDDIQNNIGISKDYNVFELQNALGKKDVLKANKIINYFGQNPKDHPFVLIPPSLYSYFVKLMLVQRTEDKSKLASVLKVSPFFVKDYQEAAQRYSPLKLVEIISILREYDLKSKGVDAGNIESGELMKEMIYRILH